MHMTKLAHQGSKFKYGNYWLPLERVVGEFPPKSWTSHFSCKSKVVSCAFHHATGYRSHQKLHVFEMMIFKIFVSLDPLIYISAQLGHAEICSLTSNGLNVQLYCPFSADVAVQLQLSLKVVCSTEPLL